MQKIPGYIRRIFLPLLVFISTIFISFSQTDSLRGKVLESFSKQTLAFVHITVLPLGDEYLSNIDGTFSIPHPLPGSTIVFERYLHRTVRIDIGTKPPVADTLLVTLNRNMLFPDPGVTNASTEQIIRAAIDLSPENNINNKKNISYRTYNKLTINVGNNDHVNELLKKLRASGLLRADNLTGDQHLYILESTANRDLKNHLHQLERVEALQSSGVRIPGVALLGTHLQHFNVYDNFVDISGKKYISPLAEYSNFNRYHYAVIDTLQLETGRYVTIAFAPKANKNFSALKGTMMININDNSVRYIIASPAFEKKGLTEVAVSYITIDHELYPERQTIYMRGTQDAGGLSPIIFSNTWYYGYETAKTFAGTRFDERILYYNDKEIVKDPMYWYKIRRTPLTTTDDNTYKYFYNGMNTMLLQKLLNIGQNVYFGKLPIKCVDLDLNKVLNHNAAEGLRLGLGGTTNSKFSSEWKLSAFLGYGFDDHRWKYGAGAERLLYKELDVWAGMSYSKELQEAGGQPYPFDHPQYSSESLRRLLINYMDYTDNLSLYLKIHPLTYLDARTQWSYQYTQPNYTYAYKGDTLTHISYTEWSNGIRYAFGEKEINLNEEHIKLQSKYPVVYLNVDKGFQTGHQPFHYTRWDLRIDQYIKIVELGKTGLQLAGGITRGEAPYSKLFVGKGSSKSAGVVVHNSFETMGYNEFAANKYMALYMSHDFGRMYYRSRFFMPSFMIIYNIGWGSLTSAADHAGPSLKSYEKGYKEAGAFLNNILVVKLSGLKIGMGAGGFLRYGEYKLPETKDNLVFKFSVNLSAGG